MRAEEFRTYLKEIDACPPAIRWAKGKTDEQAWVECHKSEWLTYWIEAASPKRIKTLDKAMYKKYPCPCGAHLCYDDVGGVDKCDFIRSITPCPTTGRILERVEMRKAG